MPQPAPHYLKASTTDGILVVTITEPQVRGDTLAEKLRQELDSVVTESGAQNFVVDLQNVLSLSSAAFRPLLSLRRRLQETGGRMVLCSLTPLVAETFSLLRLISTSRSYSATFEVEPDLETAIAFLKKN
jgi:anti-anti-sigma factor